MENSRINQNVVSILHILDGFAWGSFQCNLWMGGPWLLVPFFIDAGRAS